MTNPEIDDAPLPASSDKADRLSPSSFMRALRPEYYSDTEDRVSYVLDTAAFEHFLETITSRNQTHEFELFCRKLCERTLCPNLRPNTGPDGGGDGKTDTETLPVAEEISTLAYIGEPSAGKERWAFAFSAKEKWAGKVRSDVQGIIGTGRQYDRIYCITSRSAKAKTRTALEQELLETHGVPVTILDRSWIVREVIENDRRDIAFQHLGVGQEKADPHRLGPNDYSRSQQLADIEKELEDPAAFVGMERQRVTLALTAAKLSRNMERPRTETDGRFLRAIRLAEQNGDTWQQVQASYEFLWTSFWWFDDIKSLLDGYEAVEARALPHNHMRYLERVGNLLQLLFNSILHGHATREECKIDERVDRLRNALQSLANEPDRPNQRIEATASLLFLRISLAMLDGDFSPLPDIFKQLSKIVDDAEGLGEFDAEQFAKRVEVMGGIVGNDDAYNALVEKLAMFIGVRASEGRAGTILLQRARQLDMEHHLQIIRLAGRATTRLTKSEYTAELIEALALLTAAYRKAGLLWAARASCIFVAAALCIEAEEESAIPLALLPTMQTLAWTSMQLGHIPDTLMAIQTVNGAVATLPLAEEAKAAIGKDLRELDFALGAIFVNTPDEMLGDLEPSPDLLESLGLISARLGLLYILGHEETLRADGSLPSEVDAREVNEMMSHLASQPLVDQLAGPVFLNDGRQTLISHLMGLRIEINVDGANATAYQLAEATAGSLEAFFATSLDQDIIPHCDRFKISVVVRDDIGDPRFTVDKLNLQGTIEWPVGQEPYSFTNQRMLRELMIDVSANLLSHAFMVKEVERFLNTLFADDAVQERMMMVMLVGNSYHRFANRHQSRLSDWQDRMATRYERRSRPTIIKRNLEETPERPEERPRVVKEGRPKIDSHTDVKVSSIIKLHAWDEAKWRGTLFAEFDPRYPPILALAYENEEAARAIFTDWRERVGEADRQNAIKMAIIREHNPQQLQHYIVQVASAPEFDAMRPGDSAIVASRCLENTPSTNQNLTRFLRTYDAVGAYYLGAAILRPNGDPKILTELMILKRELSIKRAAEIGDFDVEQMALRAVLGSIDSDTK